MGVNLRGGDIGVTQHFLDCTQIPASLKHVAGKGVAKHVWVNMDILTHFNPPSLQSLLNAASGNALAKSADEQGWLHAL